ncbi:MAG: hypothetical protein GXP60_06020 [Epsilonproteobacteria bacterium]|nr:hypothetical protein [Campylobacterota bacterium]
MTECRDRFRVKHGMTRGLCLMQRAVWNERGRCLMTDGLMAGRYAPFFLRFSAKNRRSLFFENLEKVSFQKKTSILRYTVIEMHTIPVFAE